MFVFGRFAGRFDARARAVAAPRLAGDRADRVVWLSLCLWGVGRSKR